MTDTLFEIKTENLETGLRGYPVGYCPTSSVDPLKGLNFVGQAVEKLAFKEPEEVIFLLLKGREPKGDELESFKNDLKNRCHVSKEVLDAIKHLPRKGSPMKLLSSALLVLGMIETENDYLRDCLNLIAKAPIIVASVIRHHAGWGENIPSLPEIGYMENFVHMLSVPNANQKELLAVFKLFHVLHLDHGGGNLSVFVGKAVASGLEDMYGSMAAAMCALTGPRHGGANRDSLNFVKEVLKLVGESATEKDVENVIRKKLENNELVFGFGHAVLRVEDPRATLLYKVVQEKYPNDPHVKIAGLLRKVGPIVLKENPKIADPYPNVDGISGTLLKAAGFDYPEYFTVLFALSRMVGISIQIVYERCIAREGKGLPIVRPKYFYRAR